MKGVFWKEGEPFTNSMSLIVSLLIRYPEFATLKLDPNLKCFVFSFMIKKGLAPKELKKLRTEIQLSLEVFAELNQQTPTVLNISFRRTKGRSEEHTSELQSRPHLVCRLLLEKKKKKKQ